MQSQLKTWWEYFTEDLDLPSQLSFVCVYNVTYVKDNDVRKDLHLHLTENGTRDALSDFLRIVSKIENYPYEIVFVSYVQLKEFHGWPAKPIVDGAKSLLLDKGDPELTPKV